MQETAGYFVCGWLRPVIAFLKRQTNAMTKHRNDKTCNALLKCMYTETVIIVPQEDPVRGKWCVHGQETNMWVDASFLATALEVDVDIIKDMCWLHPDEDLQHINLDAPAN